jgi:enoyl-CoA hydratase/carnithine racemase
MAVNFDDVQYETDEGIATITIDRPEVYNAFSENTIAELNAALNRAERDDGVYVVVLTGTGDGFCAGADLNGMPDWAEQTEEEYAGFLYGVQNVVRRLRTMGPPTVAAVNGPAIGAGCDFALACDVRYQAPDAVLREGFVKVGLIPGDGGAWLLPRLIGQAKATEYLLTGRDITAEDALNMGLITDVAEDPLDAAHEFAAEIRELPAKAVQHTKALIDPQQSFDDYCVKANQYQWECVNDPEHEEAVRAFQEKHDPEYDRDYS